MPPRIEGQLSDALIDGLLDPCLGIDRSGVLRIFNREAGRLFDRRPAEALGRPLWDVLPSGDFTRAFSAQIKASEPVPVEQVIVFPGDRVFAVQMAPVRTERGRNLGAIAVLRDMAGVRQIERGLDHFLVDVTRRVSVPLTAIKGFVETLLEGPYQDPEITRRFLQIINEETNRLVRVVMTLEESARVGEVPVLSKQRSRLEPLVEASANMFRDVAAQKGVDVEVDLAPDLPWIQIDPDRIRRVLVNLVDNAVKFTGVRGRGRVAIRATSRGGVVHVAVSDTGVGIPESERELIFERFHRVNEGPAAGLGGTGLGLSVAREIVDAHGGSLEVESEPGEGSTFTFHLPT